MALFKLAYRADGLWTQCQYRLRQAQYQDHKTIHECLPAANTAKVELIYNWLSIICKHLSFSLKKVNIGFGNSTRFCTFDPGELAEWSIAAVLKTVELLQVPGVRIPSSPPSPAEASYGGLSPPVDCEGGLRSQWWSSSAKWELKFKGLGNENFWGFFIFAIK